MSDLAAFLLARIGEDEAVAQRNTGEHGLGDDGSFPDYRTYQDDDTRAADAFLGHYNPARVLREARAKRKILVAYESFRQEITRPNRTGSPHGAGVITGDSVLHAAAFALAAVYSDHPDYREEWSA